MAVTLSVAEFIADARIGSTADELALATRRVAYATEAVVRYAPGAPDIAHNEAVSRLAAYLYDMPTVAGGAAFANALRNSGATAILLPYRVHGLGVAEAVAEAQAAVGTTGNPVVNVSVTGDVLTVTYADGTSQDFTIATGAVGVDQTARDAAEAAQTAATAAQATASAAAAAIPIHAGLPNIHHTPPTMVMGSGQQVFVGNNVNGTPFTPANPADGDVWIRQVTGGAAIDIGVYEAVGSTWQDSPSFRFSPAGVTPAGGGGNTVTIATSAPADPAIDDVWIRDLVNSDGGHTVSFHEWTGTLWRQEFSFDTHPVLADTAPGLIAAHAAISNAHHEQGVGMGSTGFVFTSLATPTLNNARTSWTFTTAERNAVISNWDASNAIVLAFKNTEAVGSAHNRIVRIPTFTPLTVGSTQDIFHFDYGTHLDATDHDCRLVVLQSTPLVSVQLLTAGQSFPEGETLTVYAETGGGGGGMGGGGDADTTARAAAAAAQRDIDSHELATHNTDSTARTAAAAAQAEIDNHEASTHNTDGTARDAAAAAQSELDAPVRIRRPPAPTTPTPRRVQRRGRRKPPLTPPALN